MTQGKDISKKVDWDKEEAKSMALHINAAVTIVCAYILWIGLQGLSLEINNAWELGLLGVVGMYFALYRWMRFIHLHTDWDK